MKQLPHSLRPRQPVCQGLEGRPGRARSLLGSPHPPTSGQGSLQAHRPPHNLCLLHLIPMPSTGHRGEGCPLTLSWWVGAPGISEAFGLDGHSFPFQTPGPSRRSRGLWGLGDWCCQSPVFGREEDGGSLGVQTPTLHTPRAGSPQNRMALSSPRLGCLDIKIEARVCAWALSPPPTCVMFENRSSWWGLLLCVDILPKQTSQKGRQQLTQAWGC